MSCRSSTTTSSSAGRARGELGRFSAVFLDDSDAHPRVKERMALTERLIAPNAAASFHLETRGRRRSSA